LAEEALNLARSIPNTEYLENLEFSARQHDFKVPLKDFKYYSNKWFSNKQVYLIKKYFLLPITKILSEKANFPGFQIKRRGCELYCQTIFQYINIKAYSKKRSKQICIMTSPGELFEDIGKIVKRKSPTKDDTLILQNSNDWIGYLFPAKEYIEHGGYEPLATFSPIAGHVYTKEVITFLHNL